MDDFSFYEFKGQFEIDISFEGNSSAKTQLGKILSDLKETGAARTDLLIKAVELAGGDSKSVLPSYQKNICSGTANADITWIFYYWLHNNIPKDERLLDIDRLLLKEETFEEHAKRPVKISDETTLSEPSIQTIPANIQVLPPQPFLQPPYDGRLTNDDWLNPRYEDGIPFVGRKKEKEQLTKFAKSEDEGKTTQVRKTSGTSVSQGGGAKKANLRKLIVGATSLILLCVTLIYSYLEYGENFTYDIVILTDKNADFFLNISNYGDDFITVDDTISCVLIDENSQSHSDSFKINNGKQTITFHPEKSFTAPPHTTNNVVKLIGFAHNGTSSTYWHLSKSYETLKMSEVLEIDFFNRNLKRISDKGGFPIGAYQTKFKSLSSLDISADYACQYKLKNTEKKLYFEMKLFYIKSIEHGTNKLLVLNDSRFFEVIHKETERIIRWVELNNLQVSKAKKQ